MATQEGNGATKSKSSTTEVETITLENGRAEDFPGKRKMNKYSFVEGEGPDRKLGIELCFRNGAYRKFFLNPDLYDKFATHGAEQKYGDETAGLQDNIDDMVEAVDQLHERLTAGDWKTTREASALAGTSVLIKALVEVMGKPVESVRQFLKDKSQAEKLALRVNPRIKPVVERLESERANKVASVDTEQMLNDWMKKAEGAEGAPGAAQAA